MRSLPYRAKPSAPRPARSLWPDRDLVPGACILWAASLCRSLLALERGETFGAEGTLALLITLALPVVALAALRPLLGERWAARRPRRSS